MGNYVNRADIDNWPTGITIGTVAFTGNGLDDLTASGEFSGTDPIDFRVEIDGTGTPDTFRWSKDGGSWVASTVDITGYAQSLSDGVSVTFDATVGHTSADRWDFTASNAARDAIIAEIEENVEALMGEIFYLAEEQEIYLDGNGSPLLANMKNPLIGIKSIHIGTSELEKSIGSPVFTGSGLDDMSVGDDFRGGNAFDYRFQIDATGTPDTMKISRNGGVSWFTTGVALTGAAQVIEHKLTVTFAADTGHTEGDYWDVGISLGYRFDTRTISLRPAEFTYSESGPYTYTEFPNGYRNVRIVGDIGRTTVPPGIKKAVTILVRFRNDPTLYEHSGFTSEKIADESHGEPKEGRPGSLTGVVEADELLLAIKKRETRRVRLSAV